MDPLEAFRNGNLTPKDPRTQVVPPPQQFPPTPAPSSDGKQRLVSPDMPVDYRMLLLSLADQYISEARAISASIVYEQEGTSRDQYYKLMATAFCCYESVIRKPWPGLTPRDEASVRLRYAMCLFEDTDNDYLVEDLLGKGITFCDRNRLLDLKYSMQHLLARTLFKTKQKAALKYLDNTISEAITCEHTVWIYALRILRISLSMKLRSHHDMHTALGQATAITEQAKRAGDKSISAMSSIVQISIHLRIRGVDSLIEAQQAIASARADLMSISDRTSPEIGNTLSMLDVACSLDPHDYAASKSKMKRMQDLLDDNDRNANVSADGSYLVPIERSGVANLMIDTGGLFCKDASGRDCLRFQWLARLDAYALGYVLCAVALYPARQSTAAMLQNGMELTKPEYSLSEISKDNSIVEAQSRYQYRNCMTAYGLIYSILLRLGCSQWADAHQTLGHLQSTINLLSTKEAQRFKQIATYLEAVVAQATGDFTTAIRLFSSPSLAFTTAHDRSNTAYSTQLSILAAFNTLLILRSSQPSSADTISTLMSRIEPHFSPSKSGTPTVAMSNQHLTAAWNLLKMIFTTSVVSRKAILQTTINQARQSGNQLVMFLCTAHLYEWTCKNILGEKSLKTATSVLYVANDVQNQTWMCVGAGLMGDVNELEGKKEQAAKCRRDAAKYLKGLPGDLGVVNGEEGEGTTGASEMEC